MTRSVALVGFSGLTLPFIVNSNCDEYWTLDHVYLCLERKDNPWLDKVTRLFEIHHRDWYLRGELEKSQYYDEWLRKPHDFPIYMQESELNPELIPSGVKYPLDEINKELGPTLLRMVNGKEEQIEYYTSTAAYMFALAIYEKFDRIELYGIDMDSDTEYGYQKPCGEHWMGVARGRGIQVLIQEPCTLCSAVKYGYDLVPYIDKVFVNQVVNEYQQRVKTFKEDAYIASKIVNENPDSEDAVKKWQNLTAWRYLYEGAVELGGKLMMIEDNYISRQQLDLKRSGYMQGYEETKANLNVLKGQIDLVGRFKVPDKVWQTYLNLRANMFGNLGSVQFLRKLMRFVDFRKVDWDLTMEVIED